MASNWYGVHYYLVYIHIISSPPPNNYFIICVGGSSSIMLQQRLGGLSNRWHINQFEARGPPLVCARKSSHGTLEDWKLIMGLSYWTRLMMVCLSFVHTRPRSLSPAHDKNLLPFPWPLHMSWTNSSSYRQVLVNRMQCTAGCSSSAQALFPTFTK